MANLNKAYQISLLVIRRKVKDQMIIKANFLQHHHFFNAMNQDSNYVFYSFSGNGVQHEPYEYRLLHAAA